MAHLASTQQVYDARLRLVRYELRDAVPILDLLNCSDSDGTVVELAEIILDGFELNLFN